MLVCFLLIQKRIRSIQEVIRLGLSQSTLNRDESYLTAELDMTLALLSLFKRAPELNRKSKAPVRS